MKFCYLSREYKCTKEDTVILQECKHGGCRSHIEHMLQAESWIGEKQKKLESEMSKGEVSSMEDKMKKLQKHQAFQAELAAHEGRIEHIKDKG